MGDTVRSYDTMIFCYASNFSRVFSRLQIKESEGRSENKLKAATAALGQGWSRTLKGQLSER